MIKIQNKSRMGMAALTLLAISFSFGPVANAQYNQPKNQTHPTHGPLMATSDMSKQVSLPQLPDYAVLGVFGGGFKHDSLNGPNYVQEYICKETPKEVADWYRTALRNYSWSIQNDENNTLIAKAKDGSTCQIVANPHFDKNGKTSLMISYHEYHSPPPQKGGGSAVTNPG